MSAAKQRKRRLRALARRVRPLGWIGLALIPFLLWSFFSSRALVDARFNTLSAVAEARLDLRIHAGMRDGEPCVAIATASDGGVATAIVEARISEWTQACEAARAPGSRPVVVRMSEKHRVSIDTNDNDIPYERSSRARALADELIGWQYYEAASWLALNGLYDEDRAIPWWMAAPGRPIRTALRATETLILFSLQVLGLISLLISIFNLKGGEGSTTYTSVVPNAPGPAGGASGSAALDDDE